MLSDLKLSARVSYPFRDTRRIDWRKSGQLIKIIDAPYAIDERRIRIKGQAPENIFGIACTVSPPEKNSKNTQSQEADQRYLQYLLQA